MAEQLRSYTQPIINMTMHQFEHECCHRFLIDLNFAKVAANKALNNLDKILLLNDHYQLMLDFSVWDVCNPPSLKELKLLSTRHPYQPISEILRKQVDNFKERIHAQIESIIQRHANSERQEDFQYGCSCARYCYTPSEKSSLVENDTVTDFIGGRNCKSSVSRDFKIATSELIAFQINSEAKFARVHRDGISKCFLMPAEFKDDTMRNFFRVKFEEFVVGSVEFVMKADAYRGSFLSDHSCNASQNADFAEEHLERRKAELEYVNGRSTEVADLEEADVQIESSKKKHFIVINGDSPPVAEDFFTLKEDDTGVNCSLFNREVNRAQKHAVDAREVCLTDWEVRDKAQELLEKLCVCMNQIISGKHLGSDCKETEEFAHKNLFDQVDLYLRLLKKTNKESESGRRVSQVLENTLLVLEDTIKRIREPSCLENCTEVDKQHIRDRIDAHLKFYLTLGTHSTSLFYEKNQIYEKLKSRAYKVCCVCGIKTSVADESSELKDAVAFKELVIVEDGELAEWKALKNDDKDERGTLAQQCFHIANVEVDKKYLPYFACR